ncbi:MAG: cation-translocating P-type ATPase [Erysipelotrichales bacterium]|nr:cation-translocating P-type ATPase [Erysipelotrichales bacterium]
MHFDESILEVLRDTKSSSNGLSSEEAKKRFNKNKPNELTKAKKVTLWKIIINQLKDAMVLILFVASILSFVLKDTMEGIIILVIIFIDAIVGVFQEYKAENAIESLKKLSPNYAQVLRDGKINKILSSEIVVGDIVVLDEGCLIPADLRLISTFGLRVTESSLTGEALSINKSADIILETNTPLAERVNMAYSSSLVTYGHGLGVVVSIGMDTEVGHIAHMLSHQDELQTPLKKKLESIGKVLSIIGLIICLLIFSVGLINGQDWEPLLMTSIALAISIIPEGLPATATIVLAIGVERMAKKQVLIRKLPSVETLGSTSVICSDKTGTLTQNKMNVTNVLCGKMDELKKCIALANNATFQDNKFLGDPTEVSLAEYIDQDYIELKNKFERIREIPFDSKRKRMTVLVKNKMIYEAYSKGAIEELLPNCTHEFTKNGINLLTGERRKELIKMSDDYSSKACRVMAFCKKENVLSAASNNLETDNIFIGLVAMLDPPREEVKEVLKKTKATGIRTVIMTGDHPLTAETIAKQIGIYENSAITGYELMNMDDNELASLTKKHNIFARVSPYDKLRIVKAYKQNKEVVAMLGDGVNDAPSLKTADIGIAMGQSGTDVAKDASDMILLNDDFSSLVDAIFEGRKVFQNIQKVIQFLLAGNVGEILTLLFAMILGFKYMPVTAIQILWVNLATDTLPALALGVDPASKEILNSRPRKNDSFMDKPLIKRVIFNGVVIAFATLIVYTIGYRRNLHLGKTFDEANTIAQTMAFCVLAFSQLLHSFNQRSNIYSIFSSHNGHNKYLLYSLMISFGLLMCILFIPIFQSIFNFTNLHISEWLIVGVFSLLPIFVTELFKLIRYHKG